MNVAVIDYGAGNLHSLVKALRFGGAEVCVVTNPVFELPPEAAPGDSDALVPDDVVALVPPACDALIGVDALVLPGVGAFAPAAAALEPLAAEIRSRVADGLPCLGICLGMQLLFDRSDEGIGSGLGVMRGGVRRLRGARVPHIGWNEVRPVSDAGAALEPDPSSGSSSVDPLFRDLASFHAYYANSFVVEPVDETDVIAWSEEGGDRFPAAVRRGRAWGVQFHPEKSGRDGLLLIRNFLAQVRS